jgi:hypothetical protein
MSRRSIREAWPKSSRPTLVLTRTYAVLLQGVVKRAVSQLSAHFSCTYRLRKSVLSKNFMHILAIKSKDGHLLARLIWARRLKYAVV